MIPAIPPPPPRPAARSGGDLDDGHVYTTTAAGRVVLAEEIGGRFLPATRLPADYLAAELAARQWLLHPHGQGLCHVVQYFPAARRSPETWEACQASASHEEPAVCARHWFALRSPFSSPPANR